MKKHAVLLLALLLAIFCLLAPDAQAAGTHDTDHCICFGSEHIADHTGCETVAWAPVSQAYSGSDRIHFTNSGAYYLTQDEQRQITFAPGVQVTLCLNGNAIRANRTVTVPAAVTLNLCDCAGEGQVSTTWVSKENEEQRGWAVKVEEGSCNLYSGTISGKGAERGQQARSLYVTKGTFGMYGGTISGGYGVASEHFAGRGGNVYMSGATFRMLGGTISGGNAAEHGGNLYLVSTQFDMEKGTVTKGTAGTHGGNICLFASKMTMSAEAVISDGTAGAKGGNICQIGTTSKSVAELSGTVTGGIAGTYGGNISVNKGGDKPSELHLLEGCTVSDGVSRAYGDGALGGGGNLHMHGSGSIVSVDGAAVTGGQSVGKHGGNVYLENGTFELKSGTVSDGTAMYHGGNIYVDKNATVALKGGTVSGGKTTEAGDASSGGNFYVAGTVNVTGGTVTGGTAHAGGNFQIDEGTLNVAGGVVSAGEATTFGGNIHSCGTLVVNDGQITGGMAGKDGGNIAVSGLYGGEVIGTAAIKGGQIAGGTVTGGKCGANLAVVNAGSAKVVGGSFSDGKTDADENDISVTIDGVYRGAPELTLSGNVAALVHLDNTAGYEKTGITYEPRLMLTELEETAAVVLTVAEPKGRTAITGDATCRKTVTADCFGYAVSVDEATCVVTLKNMLPLWIGGGAAAVAVLAVALVPVLKKKK